MAALMLAVSAVDAQAQSAAPTLPPTLISAPAPLTADEVAVVRAFLEHHVNALKAGDEAGIAAARTALVEPLRNPNASANFMQGYASILTSLLADALRANAVLVRINAMIVARDIIHSDLVKLINQALGDQSAAVRLLAAKAARSIPDWPANQRMLDNDQGALLKTLVEAHARESEALVRDQLLLAIAGLPVQAGANEVLSILEDRARLQLRDPERNFNADIEALNIVYLRLFTARNDQKAVPEDVQKKIITVATLYLSVCAIVADQKRVPNDELGPYKRMADLCDAVLQGFIAHMAPGIKLPAKIKALVLQGKWDEVRLIAEEYIALVSKEPFSIPENQLRP